MLALEPSALLTSSPGATACLAEKGPYSTVGEFDLDGFVTQDVVDESYDKTQPGAREIKRYSTVSRLKAHKFFVFHELVYLNFIQANDPNDAEAYQILRKLHVAFPADDDDPGKLAGKRPLPLVVILHGQHQAVEKGVPVPNHLGYLYLQRELASWGIVSVSLDTNVANAFNVPLEMRAESVLKTLDALWTTAKSDASSPLYQRIDFSRIGLVGHSRGGDAVVRAAIVNSDSTARGAAAVDRKYEIKAVCSLAPTDFTGMAVSERSSLTSSQAPCFVVLYGALDGDVAGADDNADDEDQKAGTGFRLYDRADTAKAMVFFDGCNHNRFNDVWTKDDHHPDHNLAVLSREDHRGLAKEFIGGLFRWQLLGHFAPRRLFNGGARSSTGEYYSLQWSFGLRRKLDDMEGSAANGGNRQLFGSSLDPMESVAQVSGDKYTNHQTTVLTTTANAGTAPAIAYTLSFSPAQDWTAYTHLLLRVCADADVSEGFDPAATALPDFTLIVTDGSANSAEVTAAALRVPERLRRPVPHLGYRESLLFEGIAVETNRTVVHLQTVSVALGQVGGIDKSSVAALSIEIPTTAQQRQYFDSIELVKI